MTRVITIDPSDYCIYLKVHSRSST
jgi:hypothetical protein